MNTRFTERAFKLGDFSIKLSVFADPLQEFDRHFEVQAGEEAGGPPEAPLYGCLWPAAEGLASYLWQRKQQLRGLSVLEIGCGIGLPSLVCAAAGAEVTAMDHHPEVRSLLDRNIEANGLPQIRFQEASFRDPGIVIGSFSLIIGSDILYEPDVYTELEDFVFRHGRRPFEVLVADPGRFAVQRFGPKLKRDGQFELLQQPIPNHAHPIDIHRFCFNAPRSQLAPGR